MIESEKYIRKPLYVDAIEVTEHNFREASDWCSGEIVGEGDNMYIQVRVSNPMNPRQAQARVGDWILYTPRGYKIYTAKAFRNSFDPANIQGDHNVFEDQEQNSQNEEVPENRDTYSDAESRVAAEQDAAPIEPEVPAEPAVDTPAPPVGGTPIGFDNTPAGDVPDPAEEKRVTEDTAGPGYGDE